MPKILVTLPMNSTHALVGLRVKTPQGEEHMAFSKIHKTTEIEIPEGVSEDEVEIIGGACDARGQWDEGVESVVLKAAKQAEKKPEGQGEGKGDETQTNGQAANGAQGIVIEPPKPKGRQAKAADKPNDKPADPAPQNPEASTETPPADKPAEASAETPKPVEKS